MGNVKGDIDDDLREWIGRQSLFFVATAPLSATGHVNVSPKAPIGSLRVVDERTIAYLDTIGSGAETIAHLRENGRIVVMLCAFAGPPRIVRMHGRGEVILPDDARFGDLLARCAFEDAGVPEARRSIVVVHVTRVSDSCGYAVPLMEPAGTRTQLPAWGKKKLKDDPDGLVKYRRRKNTTSIDGLPALPEPDES